MMVQGRLQYLSLCAAALLLFDTKFIQWEQEESQARDLSLAQLRDKLQTVSERKKKRINEIETPREWEA